MFGASSPELIQPPAGVCSQFIAVIGVLERELDERLEVTGEVANVVALLAGRQADAEHAAAVRAAVAGTLDRFGRLDVAVANAGVILHREDRDLHIMADDAWDRTQAVNYRGVYLTCKAALAAMVEQGEGGSIIITASISSLSGAPENPAYVASKHGVLGLMRAVDSYDPDSGAFGQWAFKPIQREAGYATGGTFVIDGGFHVG